MLKLTDSAEGSVKSLTVYGKSVQNSYTGKNLFNGAYGTGILWTNLLTSTEASSIVQTENSVSVHLDTYQAGKGYYLGYDDFINKLKGLGTFTISFDALATTKVILLVCSEVPSTYGLNTRQTIELTSNEKKHIVGNYTFSSESSGSFVCYLWDTVDSFPSTGADLIISNIQIESGDTETSYEPYTGSYISTDDDGNSSIVTVKSPNPDYPQEIQSVGTDNSLKIGTNKLRNILDQTKNILRLGVQAGLETSQFSVSYNSGSDQTVFPQLWNLTNIPVATLKKHKLHIKFYLKKDSTNTFNFRFSLIDSYTYMTFALGKHAGISGNAFGDNTALFSNTNLYVQEGEWFETVLDLSKSTVTKYDDKIMFVQFIFNHTGSVSSEPINIEITNIEFYLEDEMTETEYLESSTNITNIEPLRAVPANSKDDTRATYVDSEGNAWFADKLVVNSDGTGRIVRKTVLVDSFDVNTFTVEHFTDNPCTRVAFEKFQIIGVPMSGFYCTHLPYVGGTSGVTNSICNQGTYSYSRCWLYFDYDMFNTGTTADDKTAFKTWAEENNLKVIGALRDPIEETLTSDQVSGFLKTYYPVTNISTNSDVDPDIVVEYVADTKNFIDRSFDKLKTAVSDLVSVGSSSVPELWKYQKLEYVECFGSSYIDTGYYPNYYTVIEAEFSHNENARDTPLFGVRGDSDSTFNNQYVCWSHPSDYQSQGNSTITFNSVPYTFTNQPDVGQRTYLYSSNSSASYNGYTASISGTTSYTQTHTLILLGLSNNGSIDGRKFSGKLYSFKISEHGTLVRDFVPVRNTITNTVGLLDMVNKVFYTATGTELSPGPEM